MEKEFIEEITETVEETEGKKRKKRNDEEKDYHTIKGEPEDIKVLRELLGSYGKTSKEILPHVNELLKLDQAKQNVKGSEEIISEIQVYQTRILAHINSILISKERAVEDAEKMVAERMQRKEQMIDDLQTEKAALKKEIEELKVEAIEAKQRADEAQEASQIAEKARDTAEVSVSIQKALIESLTSEKERLTAEVTTVLALKKTVEDITAENTAIRKEKEFAERTVADMKKDAERVVADHKKVLQVAQKDAENDRKAAVLEVKEAYISKIETKDEEISQLREKIATLQQENSDLQKLLNAK